MLRDLVIKENKEKKQIEVGITTSLLLDIAKLKDTSARLSDNEILALGSTFDAIAQGNEWGYILPTGYNTNEYPIASQFNCLLIPSAVKYEVGYDFRDLKDYDWIEENFKFDPNLILNPGDFIKVQSQYLNLFKGQQMKEYKEYEPQSLVTQLNDVNLHVSSTNHVFIKDKQMDLDVPIKLTMSEMIIEPSAFTREYNFVLVQLANQIGNKLKIRK